MGGGGGKRVLWWPIWIFNFFGGNRWRDIVVPATFKIGIHKKNAKYHFTDVHTLKFTHLSRYVLLIERKANHSAIYSNTATWSNTPCTIHCSVVHTLQSTAIQQPGLTNHVLYTVLLYILCNLQQYSNLV